MSERILLIRDRIITKIDTVKLEKGHFRMETGLTAHYSSSFSFRHKEVLLMPRILAASFLLPPVLLRTSRI